MQWMLKERVVEGWERRKDRKWGLGCVWGGGEGVVGNGGGKEGMKQLDQCTVCSWQQITSTCISPCMRCVLNDTGQWSLSENESRHETHAHKIKCPLYCQCARWLTIKGDTDVLVLLFWVHTHLSLITFWATKSTAWHAYHHERNFTQTWKVHGQIQLLPKVKLRENTFKNAIQKRTSEITPRSLHASIAPAWHKITSASVGTDKCFLPSLKNFPADQFSVSASDFSPLNTFIYCVSFKEKASGKGFQERFLFVCFLMDFFLYIKCSIAYSFPLNTSVLHKKSICGFDWPL